MAYEFPNCVPCTSCGSMVPVAELTALRADLKSAAVRERVYQSRVEELEGEVARMRAALESIERLYNGLGHADECNTQQCDGDCDEECIEHRCDCTNRAAVFARAALGGDR